MQHEKQQEKFFTTPLIIIYVTVFIDLVGFGMVIPILPFYANTDPFHATPFEVGLLFAIYSWMQFFFSPVLGRLSDRYGRRPILFISILGSAVGYFVIGAAETLALVFLGRIIGGVTGANISTAQAYIADVTSKENRAKGMGLFGAMFGLGFILGPAIAGILSKYGVHVPFYFAAGLSLANAIALYFVLPESIKPNAEHHAERPNRLVELFTSLRERTFGSLNLLYFLLITAFSIMTYAFVLFTAYRYGYNAEQNGYLFAYVGVIAIIGQGMLFNRLVSKFGEAVLISTGCILMIIAFFAMPYLRPEYGGLLALLAVCTTMSIGNALASPALTSLVSKISGDHEQGSALGILQSGASLARAIGPMIGGVLLNNAVNAIDDRTVTRTFWAAAVIMFVAFLASVFVLRAVKDHPAVA
ncbi:MAG: MFS transporter [Pyrinomonadaceae bacterium]|nr:MFS transporter [Pyrinomonadaceae bacterium]